MQEAGEPGLAAVGCAFTGGSEVVAAAFDDVDDGYAEAGVEEGFGANMEFRRR